MARIFHHPDGLRRLLKEIPSPANGITFCQGTITEMGADVLEEIRYFGKLGRINLVHFRAVQGDTSWGHIGRTFSHGYMRGLVHAVNAVT